MPELPEVETTVKGLQERVLNRTFIDAWSDWKKIVKRPKDFEIFKKELKGKKIQRVWRRAKNVIFELSSGYSLLVHMKMTGHLLCGTWSMKHGTWVASEDGPLKEKINGFLHMIFFLDDGRMIALSDMRKFAKVKQVIMVPQFIAGIGNIYASEALWWAKIHPAKDISQLSVKELKSLYTAIKKVLSLGVEFGGDSFSDYRDVDGKKGEFEGAKKVYQREKQKCFRCKTLIKKIKIAQRSSFYCPSCQKL